MTTLDKVPYIGQISKGSPKVLVATGFNKWGMAMGAFSGKLLTDLIMKEPTEYADFFSPTRGKFKATDIKQFVIKNATVGKDFVVSRATSATLTPEALKPDEGGLVTVDGKKAGGYRDEAGQIHLVKTTCTHMGCGLCWNSAERSWDCPCHGSRFSYMGEVLDGPAVHPLEKLNSDK
jgi:Rieske Fe-S protein